MACSWDSTTRDSKSATSARDRWPQWWRGTPESDRAQHVFEVVGARRGRSAGVGKSSAAPPARQEDSNVFVDEFVKDRASRSLAHVFTLLSLVFPSEALQIAFRGLHLA